MDNMTLPTHIGFIMDGNRRWAKERGLTTPQGHKAGAEALDRMVEICYYKGIRHITFYAFSTENWTRADAEVTALMKLFEKYLADLLKRWEAGDREPYRHTHIRFLGDLSKMNKTIRERAEKLERVTKSDDIRMTLNIALNYGGREDIVQAVNRAIKEGKTELTEKDISDRLYTAPQPDPDMIVRTGGEMRLSNFLLWQSSYAEYYSDPLHWPDFDESRLDLALEAYGKRVRKFGGK